MSKLSFIAIAFAVLASAACGRDMNPNGPSSVPGMESPEQSDDAPVAKSAVHSKTVVPPPPTVTTVQIMGNVAPVADSSPFCETPGRVMVSYHLAGSYRGKLYIHTYFSVDGIHPLFGGSSGAGIYEVSGSVITTPSVSNALCPQGKDKHGKDKVLKTKFIITQMEFFAPGIPFNGPFTVLGSPVVLKHNLTWRRHK